MTFVGSIEEGIHQDRTLMYTKSLMDGITSILLASSFGSVLFSNAFAHFSINFNYWSDLF